MMFLEMIFGGVMIGFLIATVTTTVTLGVIAAYEKRRGPSKSDQDAARTKVATGVFFISIALGVVLTLGWVLMLFPEMTGGVIPAPEDP